MLHSLSENIIPVIALAGCVTEETKELNNLGITSFFSIINEPIKLVDAMNLHVTRKNLQLTVSQLFRLLQESSSLANPHT